MPDGATASQGPSPLAALTYTFTATVCRVIREAQGRVHPHSLRNISHLLSNHREDGTNKMENYSFTSIFDPEKEMIEGWEPFANRVVEAANALNAVVASAHSMFACGAEVGALPSPMVEGLLDDIIEDLYESMMVLENPFAHLAGVLGHLAGLAYEDRLEVKSSSVPKALCYQNLLLILHRMTTMFCERTGFTARKSGHEKEDEG